MIVFVASSGSWFSSKDVEFYHVEIEQEVICVLPVAANIPMKYRCLSYIRAKDGEFLGYVQ